MKRFIFLFMVFFICACATDMTTRATRVRVVNVEQVQRCEKECEFLGNVKGRAFPGAGIISWWSVGRSIAYNNALDRILDNAAELGATHVFIDFGDYNELRGEAYRCYVCVTDQGVPDVDKCMDIDGSPDKDLCVDNQNQPVGVAHCEGQSAKSLLQCVSKGGKWVAGITETECKNKGFKWIPKATNRYECERKGKIWVPQATSKEMCEAKGGRWVPNKDVLIILEKESSK